MKRQTIILTEAFAIVMVFAIACRTGSAKAAAASTNKPNILFIMADDHTSQAVGAYNGRLSPLNPTPNIDRLFREGVVFDRVFCVNSICTPSRANILTGQYCQRNGVLDLYDGLPVERQHLSREMSKAGYATAIVGKWHLKENPDSFDYYCVLPGQGKYFDPEFYTNDGGTPTKLRFDSTLTRTVNAIKTKGHSTDIITDLALDWLKNRRPKDKPFFFMLHYKAPHDNFEHHPRYNTYLENVEIPEPDNLYGQPAPGFGSVATRGADDEMTHIIGASVSKRCVTRNIGKAMKIDQELPDPEYTHLAYQAFLKRYLRCVKGVDDNVKRIFDFLAAHDLMQNTIISYTGDQGYFLGEHDFFDKRWIYDEAMRMPLLVRYPGGKQAGLRNDWLINNTDFAPTILELAGVNVPDYMQGRSFVRVLRGEPKPHDWRTATYYRYWMHMAHGLNNPAHFGLRTARYKLIFFYGCDYTDVSNGKPIAGREGNRFFKNTPVAWEFYDLQTDPREMRNQYSNPAYAGVIADLKRQLVRLRKDLGETDSKYPHIQKIIDGHWND